MATVTNWVVTACWRHW